MLLPLAAAFLSSSFCTKSESVLQEVSHLESAGLYLVDYARLFPRSCWLEYATPCKKRKVYLWNASVKNFVQQFVQQEKVPPNAFFRDHAAVILEHSCEAL